MKRLSFFFILFNLLSLKLLAGHQVPGIDSLKKLIKPVLDNPSKLPDTLTINRLNTLAENLYESAPDSTTYFSSLALQLAKKSGYKKGMANAYVQLASVNTFRGDYTTSAQNFNNALTIYQQLNNKQGVSECYMGLGRVQDFLGDYDGAINLFNKALAIRKTLGNRMSLADCLGTIGITYDNKGEFSKALDAYFKALTIDIKFKNELAAADNYCNIGVIMQHLQLYSKALDYFNQALNIWVKLNDKQGVSTAWQNIGEVLMAQKNYTGAIGYLNKASTIYHQLGDKEGLSLIYYDLGLYHYYTGHLDSALNYLNRSLQSASQYKIKYNKAYAYLGLAMVYNLEKNYPLAYSNALLAQSTASKLGSLNTRVDATFQVSKALAGLKRYEEAYKQHMLHETLKDSLENNENIEKITSYSLEVEFGTRQKEIDVKYEKSMLLQQRAIGFGAVAIIILLAMIGIYVKAKNKQQKINHVLTDKNAEILAQKHSLDTQADKLHDLNNLKDRLIAVLAHDLRAPLSTLRGLFALMADESISHDEFVKMIPQVFSKLEHTSDFLDTLLSWINSQVDRAPEHLIPVNLNETVKQELIYVDELMERKNITPVINVSPDAIVFAEPGSVRIVVHNFLTNAVKFSPRDGQVTIAAAKHGNEVHFTVTDCGAGIKPVILDALFRNRVNSSLGTENESGTGMGLYFCKDLIERYHGTIWAKNTGTGAELGFKLPA